MADPEYYFSGSDVRKQRDVNRRVLSGRSSQQPRARRRRGKVGGFSVTVYEFRNCGNPSEQLYLDNAEAADHDAGEVAVIARNGVYECWQLYGPAQFCNTGECALILSWGANCNECSTCFNLTPCGGGSPTTVRGVDWFDYVDRVVKLDGPGHEGCYTVAKATGCFGVDDAIGVEHIVAEYDNCDGCGCYELTSCNEMGSVKHVDNDLRKITGDEAGQDTIGKVIKFKGVCWTITAFNSPCGTTPEHWDYDYALCGFGLADPLSCPKLVDSCEGCCYLLTPCEGQSGEAEPFYLHLAAADETDPNDFLNDDGTSNGRVILLAGHICYSWSVPENCPEGEVVLGLPTVLGEFDSCEECIPTCWERCDEPGTYILTFDDLSDVGPNAAVRRAEDGHCYKRTTLGECDGEVYVDFTPEVIFDLGEESCEVCLNPRIKLTPCANACTPCMYSGGDFPAGEVKVFFAPDEDANLVGKYIKADGVCYFVEWTTDELSEEGFSCVSGPFDSCAQCASAPSRLKVIARMGDAHKEVEIQGSFNVCSIGDWDGSC